MQEPGIREQVIKILWQKQFEGTPWHDKFDLIRPNSLGDYGALADQIIAAVRSDIEQCFTLIDRRSSGAMTDLDCVEYAIQVVLARCRKRDPAYMSISISGETALEWLSVAMREAKEIRGAHGQQPKDSR